MFETYSGDRKTIYLSAPPDRPVPGGVPLDEDVARVMTADGKVHCPDPGCAVPLIYVRGSLVTVSSEDGRRAHWRHSVPAPGCVVWRAGDSGEGAWHLRVKNLAFGGGAPEVERSTEDGRACRPDVWVQRPGGGWAVEVQHSAMDRELAVHRMRLHRETGAVGTLWVLDARTARSHADWDAWNAKSQKTPTSTWVQGRRCCPVEGAMAREVVAAIRTMRAEGYAAAVVIMRAEEENPTRLVSRRVEGGGTGERWGYGGAYLVRRYGPPVHAGSWHDWSTGVETETTAAIDAALRRELVDADRWYEIDQDVDRNWTVIRATADRAPGREMLARMRKAGFSTTPRRCKCRTCKSWPPSHPLHHACYWGPASTAAERFIRAEFGWKPDRDPRGMKARRWAA